MKPFLEKVTDYYLSEKESSDGNIGIVTPNRRAALFIRSHISKKTSKTIWAPEIISLEELINKISGLKIIDNITLLMEFYRAVNDSNKNRSTAVNSQASGPDTFEELLHWAPLLLQDFNEIDSNLKNPETLFNGLSDIKKLEAWSPGQEPTPFQKQYIEFFNNIPLYHNTLKSNLLSKGIAYQGLSHHIAASKIEKDPGSLPWTKLIFAGLNALSQSEERIISELSNNNQAVVIWDTDDYYVSEKKEVFSHEAGTFIRKYNKKWHNKTITIKENCFKDQIKNIKILGTAKNINQVQLAGNILYSKINKDELEQTAVVLADETLITPMLSALPEYIDKVNITMGYPLSQTGFYAFAKNALSMHIRSSNSLNNNKSKQTYYYKDILRILKHPYSKLILKDSDNKDIASVLINKINNSNRSFYNLEMLNNIDSGKNEKAIEMFFSDWNNSPEKAISFFKKTLQILEEQHITSPDQINNKFSIDLAAFNQFALLLNRFDIYLELYNQPANLQSFKLIFSNLVSGINIPFSGEPLEGLQIMGMLETRNLDFKNLIVFPVNETILPKGKSQNSFIPYDLKKKYGLHTHKERDAIYAYHFYRLLQRAENIFLLYNTQANDIGSGEKSRFITQIEHELSEYNPNINIKHDIIPLTVGASDKITSVSITKTPDIMEQIKNTGQKGFSPSSLSIYMKCSLQFYFRKIMNIEEAEEVEETIEQKTLGLAIHDVLEKIFEPIKGKTIKKEDLNISHDELVKIAKEKFSRHYSEGDLNTGRNYLLFRVALKMIKNYLENEKETLYSEASQNINTTIISLEKPYESELIFKNNSHEINLKLKGKADRIDKTNNLHRIIDYKTGKVEEKELKIREWKDILENTDTDKSFQLLCYSWLFFKEHNDLDEVLPSIVSFRNPSHGLFKMQHPLNDSGIVSREATKEFEENVLKTLFAEIYDNNIPFHPTDNTEHCKYCAFNVLCKRI